MNSRRLFLYLLIGSVAVSAIIGIGVLLFGDFGEFETRVLMTSLIVTSVSVMGLSCGAAVGAGKGRIVPLTGMAFAVLSGVLWMVMLWSRPEPNNDVFAHAVMSATVLALACALVSLLSLATLDRRFYWSRITVHIAVWVLTALLLFIFRAHIDPSLHLLARSMGVLSIIIAALTVVTPVFHYMSSNGDDAAKLDGEIKRLEDRLSDLKRRREGLS